MSFDAFGKRRSHADWATPLTFQEAMTLTADARTNRGYTGHEQMDEVDLIHMKDKETGIFGAHSKGIQGNIIQHIGIRCYIVVRNFGMVIVFILSA